MAALCGENGKTQDWLKASIRVEQKKYGEEKQSQRTKLQNHFAGYGGVMRKRVLRVHLVFTTAY